MAQGAIHLGDLDEFKARISGSHDAYRYVVIEIGPQVCIYFPTGEGSPKAARALAAALTEIADAYDAQTAAAEEVPSVTAGAEMLP